MDDLISAFREATEAGDVEGFMSLIAPDAELVSPISGPRAAALI